MRTLLALLLAFIATAAPAAEWGHYVNERFGVEADVPPGFLAEPPPANGDGQGFATATAHLAIYGSLIVEGDFESTATQRLRWAEQDGWIIGEQSVTPGWANWSASKGGRVMAGRAIRMCDGAILGGFELEYSRADLQAFAPVVERLAGSLRDSGTGWQC